eukprot:782387-Karenia_brevis.AAC.1
MAVDTETAVNAKYKFSWTTYLYSLNKFEGNAKKKQIVGGGFFGGFGGASSAAPEKPQSYESELNRG